MREMNPRPIVPGRVRIPKQIMKSNGRINSFGKGYFSNNIKLTLIESFPVSFLISELDKIALDKYEDFYSALRVSARSPPAGAAAYRERINFTLSNLQL